MTEATPKDRRPGAKESAVVLSGLLLLYAAVTVLVDPVHGLLLMFLFSAVLIGIMRNQSWAARAGALLVLSSLIPIGRLALMGHLKSEAIDAVVLAAVSFTLAFVFFWAARSLDEGGPLIRAVWCGLVGVVYLYNVIFQNFVVPTASMEDTIMAGDRVALQVVGFPTPGRQQMVACRPPGQGDRIYLRRVIGLPGDRLRIMGRTLFVNGVEQREPYTKYVASFPIVRDFPSKRNSSFAIYDPKWKSELERRVVNGELVVPPGQLFLMGDNRDNSADSRINGFVPQEDIIGVPAFVRFSYPVEENPPLQEGPSMPQLIIPTNIRWERVFTFL